MTTVRKKVGDKVYLYKYKNVREGEKVKHKFVKYLGVEGKDGKPIKRPKRILDKVELGSGKLHGAVALLWKLSQELGFEEVIDRIVGERKGFSAGKLLTLCCINKCLDPKSLSKLHYWYGRTDLPNLSGYSKEIVSKNNVLSAMDTVCGIEDDEEYDLTLKIEKELFKRIKEKIPKNFLDSMLYDLTATIYHGSKCILAEAGHKTRDGKTQINVALVVSRIFHIPIFHKVFKGNVRDIKTVGNLIQILNSFNVKDVTLIWDRGNTSNDTINWAEEQKMNLIVGLRKDLLEVRKLYKELPVPERPDTLIKKYDKGAIYAKSKVRNVFGKKRKVVIYTNTFIRDQTRTARNEKIKKALDKLKELSNKTKKGFFTEEELNRRIKTILSGIKDYVWIHFDYDKKEYKFPELQFGIQEDELEKAECGDGKYALLSTNLSLSTEEIVNSYFEKDKIERAFRVMKHVMDMSTVKHNLSYRVKCYMFICFLSYYLFSYLEYKLREAGIGESVEHVLERLNEIEKVEIKYGNQIQTRFLNLGTEHKEILRKIDPTICPQKKLDRYFVE